MFKHDIQKIFRKQWLLIIWQYLLADLNKFLPAVEGYIRKGKFQVIYHLKRLIGRFTRSLTRCWQNLHPERRGYHATLSLTNPNIWWIANIRWQNYRFGDNFGQRVLLLQMLVSNLIFFISTYTTFASEWSYRSGRWMWDYECKM